MQRQFITVMVAKIKIKLLFARHLKITRASFLSPPSVWQSVKLMNNKIIAVRTAEPWDDLSVSFYKL